MIHIFIVNVYIEYKKFFGAGGNIKKQRIFFIRCFLVPRSPLN